MNPKFKNLLEKALALVLVLVMLLSPMTSSIDAIERVLDRSRRVTLTNNIDQEALPSQSEVSPVESDTPTEVPPEEIESEPSEQTEEPSSDISGLTSDITPKSSEVEPLTESIQPLFDGTPNAIVSTAAALQAAITASTGTASSPYVILVDTSITISNISTLISGKYVQIESADPNNPITLTAQSGYRHFSVAGTLILGNIILDGGASNATGGGINVTSNTGNVTFNSGVIARNNRWDAGGVINSDASSSVTFNGGTFTNNSAANGGVIYSYGTAQPDNFNGGTFTNNSATGDGGVGYFAPGSILNVGSGLVFDSNKASSQGGVFFFPTGAQTTITFGDSLFNNNQSQNGGVLYVLAPSTITITDGTFTNNTTRITGAIYGGGALAMGAGSLNISSSGNSPTSRQALSTLSTPVTLPAGVLATGTVFYNNTSGTVGGAIYNYGTGNVSFTIDGATFQNSSANTNGGALYLNSTTPTVNITNSIFDQNSVTTSGNGGGTMYLSGNFNLTMDSVIVTNSSSLGNGGALNFTFTSPNNAKLTITNSTFYNNSLTGNYNGGAIYISASNANTPINFTGTTFDSNSTQSGSGGAIYFNSLAYPVLTGTTFTNNSAQSGGAMYFNVGLTNNLPFSGVTFTNNKATNGSGGAIYFNNATTAATNTSFTDFTFTGNTASVSGGALYFAGTATTSFNSTTPTTLTSSFNTNTAANGGAIYFNAATPPTAVPFNYVNFTGNQATNGAGGAINFNNNAYASFNNVTLANNTATGNGGGFYFSGTTGTASAPMTFSNLTMTGNTAANGGAMHFAGAGGASFNTVTASNNSATANGGVLNFASTTTTSFTGFNASNNSANTGGAIYLGNTSSTSITHTIDSSTFTSNTARSGNGGALVISSPVTITGNTSRSAFTGNTASANGGAISTSTQGPLTITATDFNNNAANAGGGIYSVGSVTLNNGVAFSGNTATTNGGAINFAPTTASTTYQLTSAATAGNVLNFTGNKATNGNGGAIYLGNNAYMQLVYTNFNNNTAYNGDGGAIYIVNAPAYTNASTTTSVNFAGNRASKAYTVPTTLSGNMASIQGGSSSLFNANSTVPQRVLNNYDVNNTSTTRFYVSINFFDNNQVAIPSLTIGSINPYFAAPTGLPDYSTYFRSIGYIFNGWNTKPDLSGTAYSVGEIVTVAETNISLYPDLTPMLKMSYDANGGTGTLPAVQYFVAGDGLNLVVGDGSGLSRYGYEFIGWNTQADGLGDSYQPGDIINSASASFTLYAQWGIDTFTVSFNLNSGILPGLSSQIVNYGSSATNPGNPTLTGYIFAGWFVTSPTNSNTPFVFGTTPVNGDITLTAGWRDNNNNVFLSGGNDASPVIFNGTYVDPSGTLQANPGGSTISVPVTRTVTFNLNSGTLSGLSNAIVPYGGSVKNPGSPTLVGYIFAGWFETSPTTSASAFNFDTSSITDNTTLTAGWTDRNGNTFLGGGNSATPVIFNGSYVDSTGTLQPNTSGTVLLSVPIMVSVVFNAQDSRLNVNPIGPASQSVAYGAVAKAPTTDPIVVGFQFMGWTTDDTPSASSPVFDFANTPITSYNADYEFVLNAIYVQRDNVIITYNVNTSYGGGSATATNSSTRIVRNAPASPQTIPYNQVLTAPTPPTSPGYLFNGWYTDNTLTTPFDFDPRVQFNTTLIASWIPQANVSVTFNSNTTDTVVGMPTTPVSVLYNDYISQPSPDPIRVGYSFSFWSTVQTAVYTDPTTAFDFSNTLINANTTLYAVWQSQLPSAVTFNLNYPNATAYTPTTDINGNTFYYSTVAYNSLIVQPPSPRNPGFRFNGWYVDAGLSQPFDFTSTRITSATTIYAAWQGADGTSNTATSNAITYIVNFNPGVTGWNPTTAATSQSVLYSETATQPLANPVNPGNSFGGWSRVAPGNTQPVFNVNTTALTEVTTGIAIPIPTTPNGNVLNLYAIWNEASNIDVTFDPNNGSATFDQSVVFEGNATVPTPEPILAGYVFAGWFAPNATRKWQFGQAIVAPITLTAGWSDANGNIFLGGLDTDTGIFDGPYIDSNLALQANTGGTTESTPISVKVNFMSRAVVSSTTSILYNSVVAQPSNPILAGYRFGGWTLVQANQTNSPQYDFTTLVDNSIATLNATTPISYSLSIYAIWIGADGTTSTDDTTNSDNSVNVNNQISINVVTNYNDQGVTPTSVTPILYNTAYAEPTTDPERVGYTFGGWYTDSGLTVATTDDTWINLNTSNLTLFASWNPISVEVGTDGRLVDPATDPNVTFGQPLGSVFISSLVPPTPPQGEEFGGWAVLNPNYDDQAPQTGDNLPYLDANGNPSATPVLVNANTIANIGVLSNGLTPIFATQTFTVNFVNLGIAADESAADVVGVTIVSTDNSSVPVEGNSFTVNYGQKVTLPTSPNSTDPTSFEYNSITYEFVGWYKESDAKFIANEPNTSFDDQQPTEGANLPYLDSDNNPTAVSGTVQSGTTGDPATPFPATPFDFATAITADTTIYGVWNPPTFVITFHANVGAASTASTIIDMPDPIILNDDNEWTAYADWVIDPSWTPEADFQPELPESNAKPIMEHYNFAGWSTDPDAIPRADANFNNFTNNELFVGWAEAQTSNLDLYAIWLPDFIPININDSVKINGELVTSYEFDGYWTVGNASVTNDAVFDQAIGDAMPTALCSDGSEVDINGICSNGYVFDGWQDASGNWVTEDTVVNADNVDDIEGGLIAVFSTLTGIVVNYVGNGATIFNPGAQATETLDFGDTYTIPDVNPIREGYVFAGWSIIDNPTVSGSSPDFTLLDGDNNDVSITSDTKVASVENPQTIYAIWIDSNGDVVDANGNVVGTSNPASPIVITITFQGDGGTPVPSDESVLYNAFPTQPSVTPIYPGFMFAGWSTITPDTVNGANVPTTPGTPVNAFNFNQRLSDESYLDGENSITLYAVWVDKNNNVLTNSDYDGDNPNPAVYAGVDEEGNPIGVDIDGDPVTDDYGTPLEPNAITIPVTFDLNGGFFVTQPSQLDANNVEQVLYNGNATDTSVPIRLGYKFTGWVRTLPAPADTSVFSFENYVVTSPITITAQWTPMTTPYNVVFNTNGSTNFPVTNNSIFTSYTGNTNVPYDSLVSFPSTQPIRPGFTFAYWTTDNPVEDTSTEFNSHTRLNEYSAPTNTLTLNAVWLDVEGHIITEDNEATTDNAIYVPIHFVLLNGTTAYPTNPTSMADDEVLLYGMYTGPSTNPTRNGFVWGGWFNDASLTSQFTGHTINNVDGITLYARWLGTTYQLDSNNNPVLDANGNPLFVANPDGSPVLSTATSDANAIYYIVTFDGNGASLGTIPVTQRILSGDSATRPTSQPTLPGYQFVDWFVTPNTSGNPYDFSSSVTSNLTITAGWRDSKGNTFLGGYNSETGIFNGTYIDNSGNVQANTGGTTVSVPISITVTFDPNGGGFDTESDATKSFLYNSELTVPTAYYPGFSFDAWHISAITGPIMDTGDIITQTSNFALIATWLDVNDEVLDNALDPVTKLPINPPVYPGNVDIDGNPVLDSNGVPRPVNAITIEVRFDVGDGVYYVLPPQLTEDEESNSEFIQDALYTGFAIAPTPDPVLAGNSFDGWLRTAPEPEDTVLFSFKTTRIVAPITLSAQFTEVTTTYTVIFNTNGNEAFPVSNTFDTISPVQYNTLLSDIVPSTTPVRPGFTFKYWTLDNPVTSDSVEMPEDTLVNDDTTTNGDLTLTAVWADKDGNIIVTDDNDATSDNAIYVPIKFVLNGSPNYPTNPTIMADDEVLLYGMYAGPSTNPTRNGFVWGGWFNDESLTSQFTGHTINNVDGITLYARWLGTTYQVDPNTGDPIKDANGNPLFVANPDGSPVLSTATSDANAIYYIVTFDGNGASLGTIPVTQRVLSGTPISAPATNPSLPGYQFVNWYITSPTALASASAYVFTTPVNNNLTLSAGWRDANNNIFLGGYTPGSDGQPGIFNGSYIDTDNVLQPNTEAPIKLSVPIEIEVTFNANGGTPTTSTKTVVYNTPLTLPSVNFPGFKFVEWRMNSIDGNAYVPGSNVTQTSDFTLVATWQGTNGIINTDTTSTTPVNPPILPGNNGANAFTVTVTFDSYGGTSVAGSPLTILYSSAITQPTDPIMPGFMFGGWNFVSGTTTPATTVNTTYGFSPTTYATTNVTLRAIWLDKIGNVINNALDSGGLPINPPIYPGNVDVNGNPVYNDQGELRNDNAITVNLTISNLDHAGSSDVRQVLYNDLSSAPSIPIIQGYRFNNWTANQTWWTDWSSRIIGNVTVTANWVEGATYSVAFNTNGNEAFQVTNTFATITSVQYNTLLSDIVPTTNPIRPGFTFRYWTLDSSVTLGSAAYPSNTLVNDTTTTNDVLTLTAVWVDRYGNIITNDNQASTANAIYVAINFNLNGNEAFPVTNADSFENVPASVTGNKLYNQSYTVPTTIPVRPGFVFEGWYSDSTLETSFTNGLLPQAGLDLYASWLGASDEDGQQLYIGLPSVDANGNIVVDDDGNVVYDNTGANEGQPTPIVYKVTFNPNGGTLESNAIVATLSGTSITAPTTAPVLPGYKFAGWFANTSKYDFSSLVTSDLKLTAGWTDANGNTFLGGANDEYPVIFNGPFIDSTNTLQPNIGRDILSSPIIITITFNSNGAATTPATQTGILYNVIVTRPVDPIKIVDGVGYLLTNWNTTLNGTGTNVDFTNRLQLETDTTLYAQWSPQPNVTVTLSNIDGAGGTSTVSIPYSGNITSLDDPEAFGKSFVGWNTVADGSGSDVDFSQPVRSNVTIYAIFSDLPTVTASFTLNVEGLDQSFTLQQQVFVGYTINENNLNIADSTLYPIVLDNPIFDGFTITQTHQPIDSTTWTQDSSNQTTQSEHIMYLEDIFNQPITEDVSFVNNLYLQRFDVTFVDPNYSLFGDTVRVPFGSNLLEPAIHLEQYQPPANSTHAWYLGVFADRSQAAASLDDVSRATPQMPGNNAHGNRPDLAARNLILSPANTFASGDSTQPAQTFTLEVTPHVIRELDVSNATRFTFAGTFPEDEAATHSLNATLVTSNKVLTRVITMLETPTSPTPTPGQEPHPNHPIPVTGNDALTLVTALSIVSLLLVIKKRRMNRS